MTESKAGDAKQARECSSTETSLLYSTKCAFPWREQVNFGEAFINDSIDLGDSGRINYRTGSFLGRFIEHHGDSKRVTNNNASAIGSLSRGGHTLSDYMLGNSETAPLSLQPAQTHAAQPAPIKAPVPKVPIELSKTAELDPVLALLQSDVSQLDEFRNSFREKSKFSCLLCLCMH